jgi:hypothetical protein
MKFKIVWLEYHVCINEKEEKEYLEYLPISSKVTGYLDRVAEFECIDTFKAKNIEEAKKVIKEDYNEVEIFTVFNAKTGKILFTEEDLEN